MCYKELQAKETIQSQEDTRLRIVQIASHYLSIFVHLQESRNHADILQQISRLGSQSIVIKQVKLKKKRKKFFMDATGRRRVLHGRWMEK